jgi:hypothetical protein
MKVLRDAAWRRAGCVVLVLTSLGLCHAAQAQSLMWHRNALAKAESDIPRTLSEVLLPAAAGSVIQTSKDIKFEVPILPGVHENFDVEVVAVKALHQLPQGVDPITAFFAAHPDADFAYQYSPNALINDCDGDGVPSLGAGSPPCWGTPSAVLRIDDIPAASLPTNIRCSTPITCIARPTFFVKVSAPPLLNGGIVGIKVKGINAGYFIGASTMTWNPSPWGHAWVKFKDMRSTLCPGGAVACYWGFGKYPVAPRPYNPGVIRDDTNSMADYTLWYPVTMAQWRTALQAVRNLSRADFDFDACDDNCVVFVEEVFTATGLWLPPSAGALGCPCPSSLKSTFRNMLQNNIAPPNCGYIVVGGMFEQPQPTDGFDMQLALEILGSDPALLASRFEMPFSGFQLGTNHLRTNGNLVLDLDFGPHTFAMVDFGDGTVVRGVPGDVSHTYTEPGSFEARVNAFGCDEIRSYEFTVVVGSKGKPVTSRSVSVPDAPPSGKPGNPPELDLPPMQRPCPSDIDGSWETDGGDLAEVLAAWGSDSLESDANGDGIIDGNDLAIVLAGWGVCDPG